jgi:hypothetical protein
VDYLFERYADRLDGKNELVSVDRRASRLGVHVERGKSGPDLTLAWTVLANAASYDIVSGALSTLRSTAGNYTAATQKCVASKLVATGRTVAGPNPPAGDGVWFIVRGANCRGRGTYDESSPRQIGSRDAEIAASPSACP